MLQKKLIKGNRKALEEVYNLYFSRVYALVFKYVRNKNTSLDLVQDTFVKLWKNRSNIAEELPLDQQLFVLSKNIVFDYFRKKIKEEKLLEEYKRTTEQESRITEAFHQDRFRKLQGLIENLPERQKEVFTLIRLQGLSYEEAAERLHISKNTVSNHYSAALRKLRGEK